MQKKVRFAEPIVQQDNSFLFKNDASILESKSKHDAIVTHEGFDPELLKFLCGNFPPHKSINEFEKKIMKNL